MVPESSSTARVEAATDAVAAILDDPALTEPTRRCLTRFFRWGAAPTVDAYCDLFAAGGTLLDADMEAPISGEAIRESITRVLALLPDFRFTPLTAIADGSHLFVLASNRATLGDRSLAWEAVYALTLHGDRIGAGRRYYDQAALLEGGDTFAADVVASPEVGAPARAAALALDPVGRAVAWNRRDVGSLVAPLAAARFRMSGLSGELAGPAEVAGALARFAVRSEGLAVRAGAVATSAAGTAIEWVGAIGTETRPRRFAMVELVTPATPPREWRLLFNSLGLRA